MGVVLRKSLAFQTLEYVFASAVLAAGGASLFDVPFKDFHSAFYSDLRYSRTSSLPVFSTSIRITTSEEQREYAGVYYLLRIRASERLADG